jgi:hypothetical protein
MSITVTVRSKDAQAMPAIDDLLPVWDWHERHQRTVPAAPEEAVAAFLGTPVAPDVVVRTLLRMRGLRADATIEEAFRRMGFDVLHRGPAEIVVGASGTPWRARGAIRRFGARDAGTVRMATDIRAEPTPGGSVLSTETRVAAIDDAARRSFGRYWRVVGPFSALVRRRWLAAVERSVRSTA